MSAKKTVRTRCLEAIAKKNMTASETQAAIGLSHGLKPTLDEEVARGHLKAVLGDEGGATTYAITPAGRTAVKNGTVDPKRGTLTAGSKPAANGKANAKKGSPKPKAKTPATAKA